MIRKLFKMEAQVRETMVPDKNRKKISEINLQIYDQVTK